MASPNPKPGRKLNGYLIKSIQDFYLSDTVSRVMPGIKDYVSVYSPGEERRIHKQKQLVLCNLKEAYQQFRTEFPEVNVGFSKFAELIQNNVFWLGHLGHTVYASALYTRMSNLC